MGIPRSAFSCHISLLALLGLFLFVPLFSHAQFSGITGIGELLLITNPLHPAPHTPTEVTIDDYSIDTLGGTVRWFVDGEEQTLATNERTIVVLAKDFGEKTSIRAVISRPNAPAYEKTIDIVPSRTDLIVESNTRIPVFYKGRALPSDEAQIRAVVVFNDGSNRPASAYSYKWTREDGSVLYGGIVKGKNIATLTMPRYRNQSLTVQVYTPEGILVGRKTVELRAVAPEIHFYEESPLRGLLDRTVKSPLPLLGEEVTVHGEPYYLDASMDTGSAEFNWKINGEATLGNSDTPNAITLRHMGGTGSADLTLDIVTKRKIPQVLDGAFSIFFE